MYLDTRAFPASPNLACRFNLIEDHRWPQLARQIGVAVLEAVVFVGGMAALLALVVIASAVIGG